jgi:hypothetical protein
MARELEAGQIDARIIRLRGLRVMLDADLAARNRQTGVYSAYGGEMARSVVLVRLIVPNDPLAPSASAAVRQLRAAASAVGRLTTHTSPQPWLPTG